MTERRSTSKFSLWAGYASAVADHSTSTGHNIKWNHFCHFKILASGQSDLQSKIKETLLMRDLKPALNENVGLIRTGCSLLFIVV